MRCVSKVCYLWLALLFLKTVHCISLLHVLNVGVGHIQVGNHIAFGGFQIVVHNMYQHATLRMSLCSILYMWFVFSITVCSTFTL
jgi:hypothetical protein